MAYAAKAAQGSYLQMGSPLTTINGVQGISISGGDKPDIETTAINSTARTYVQDLPNPYNISFTLAYDSTDAQHLALETAFNAGTLTAFNVVLNDAGSAAGAFNAYVKQWTPKAEKGSFVAVDVTLLVSGGVTWS